MSMPDSVLRELSERRRISAKREQIAAERRAGPSPSDVLEQAANETLSRMAARHPSTAAAPDVSVSMDDVDVDLVGHAGFAEEYGQRLQASIEQGMMAGFGDVLNRMKPETRAALLARDDVDDRVKRPFVDRERVGAELRPPAYKPPVKAKADPDKPPPGLTGTALIEWAANRDLARLLAPKRTRRR